MRFSAATNPKKDPVVRVEAEDKANQTTVAGISHNRGPLTLIGYDWVHDRDGLWVASRSSEAGGREIRH
jgi:hypothetical protein